MPPITAQAFARDLFWQNMIRVQLNKSYEILWRKCRIMVPQSAFLLGIVDEHGVLEENEIFFQVSSNNRSLDPVPPGKVAVANKRALRASDLQVYQSVALEAIGLRSQEALRDFTDLVNVVVFPKKGAQIITQNLQVSDYDGEVFLVCWDQRLVPDVGMPLEDIGPVFFQQFNSSQKHACQKEKSAYDIELKLPDFAFLINEGFDRSTLKQLYL